MQFLKTLGIGWKLSLSAIAATALILSAALAVVAATLWHQAKQTGDTRLEEAAQAASSLLTGYDDTFRKAALRDFSIYRALFTQAFELVEATGPEGKPAPQLKHGADVLNGNFDIVDNFTRATGSPATVFARAGDDFVRITTSVKKEDGSRAVGTFLGKASPAYADMMEGRTRVDRFPLFGTTYMHVYEPIRQGDRTIGVLYIGVKMTDALAQLGKTLQAQHLYKTGAVYGVDLRPGASLGQVFGLEGGTPRKLAGDGVAPEAAELFKRLQAEAHGRESPAYSVMQGRAGAGTRLAWLRNPAWNWVVAAEVPEHEITADARAVIALFAAAVAATMAVLGALMLWLSRRLIGRPVAALDAALGRLAAGDLTQPLQSNAQDEIGTLVRSMERFRLTLADTLATVRSNAELVNAASRQIAQGNAALSDRTASQAGALQQTAASMAQLGTAIGHSAASAREADTLAQGASTAAGAGGAVVSRVVDSMQAIDATSRKIADIVGVVDGLAFQTNILALNAAVEAARAGEQGRGFAVVASEVRSLAQRSAQAAKEIKGLIGASVDQAGSGAALAQQAGAAMARVVDSFQHVSRIVGEISSAAAQQAAGIVQVNQAVAQLDEMTQRNAALVQESAAASDGLQQQAGQLEQAVQAFRLRA